MKKIVRKYIRESINNLFESTAEEIKNIKDDITGDIERADKFISRTNDEIEVAKSQKTNIQKTKGNMKDIDPTVEKLKKTLAMKEFQKFKNLETDKKELVKDLEGERLEDIQKKSDVEQQQPETNSETATADAQPMTPDTPTSAGATG